VPSLDTTELIGYFVKGPSRCQTRMEKPVKGWQPSTWVASDKPFLGSEVLRRFWKNCKVAGTFGFPELSAHVWRVSAGESSYMTKHVHGFGWQEFTVSSHRTLVSCNVIENSDGLPNDFDFNGGRV